MENICLPSIWSEIDSSRKPYAISGFGLSLVPVFRRVFSLPGFRGFPSSTLRAIFIKHEFPKIIRWGQMAYKFPGKVSRTSDDCWIFVQPKIPQILGGIKKPNPKILGRNLPVCPLFRKYRKMLVHSPPQTFGNANRSFWLNGKGPKFPNTNISHLDGRTLLNDFTRALPCCRV